MTKFFFNLANSARMYDAIEWGIGATFGVTRDKHDSAPCTICGDFTTKNGVEVSVKSGGASICSGRLLKGATEFDDMYNVFESIDVCNMYVFGFQNGTAYAMDKAEFKQFVYAFGYATKESAKNGGASKIRLLKESKRMMNWFEERI